MEQTFNNRFFTVNLIRQQLLEKRRNRLKNFRRTLFLASYFAILFFLMFVYSLKVVTLLDEKAIKEDKLLKINARLKYLESAKDLVLKKDILLLDYLQNHRIFWTKKLVTLAKGLPKSFRFTNISSKMQGNTIVLKLNGTGNINEEKQKQLLILDKYISYLQADKDFSALFTNIKIKKIEKVNSAKDINKNEMQVRYHLIATGKVK